MGIIIKVRPSYFCPQTQPHWRAKITRIIQKWVCHILECKCTKTLGQTKNDTHRMIADWILSHSSTCAWALPCLVSGGTGRPLIWQATHFHRCSLPDIMSEDLGSQDYPLMCLVCRMLSVKNRMLGIYRDKVPGWYCVGQWDWHRRFWHDNTMVLHLPYSSTSSTEQCASNFTVGGVLKFSYLFFRVETDSHQNRDVFASSCSATSVWLISIPDVDVGSSTGWFMQCQSPRHCFITDWKTKGGCSWCHHQ